MRKYHYCFIASPIIVEVCICSFQKCSAPSDTRMGKNRGTHQVAVGVVAVFLRHGQIHRKSYTVGKDGQQDYDLKRSVANSLESYTQKWWATLEHYTKKTGEKKTCTKREQHGDKFPETSVRILPLHNAEASLAERILQSQEEEGACRPWVAACGHQLLQLFLLFPLQRLLIHDVGRQRRAVAVHHCWLQTEGDPENSLQTKSTIPNNRWETDSPVGSFAAWLVWHRSLY